LGGLSFETEGGGVGGRGEVAGRETTFEQGTGGDYGSLKRGHAVDIL